MPTFTRGSVRFESKLVTQRTDRDRAIFEWDCFPPPEGYEKTFPPPGVATVLDLPEFLQPEEQDGLTQAARATPDEALTWPALMDAVSAAFGFRPFPIDLSKIPNEWRRRELCYDTKVVVVATHVVFEITARATSDLQFGGVQYPAGDVIATFRIGNPNSYRFVRRFVFNPKCCPGQPADERFPETAGETVRNVLEPTGLEGWEFKPRLRFTPDLRFEFDRKTDGCRCADGD
jgi:hypothetical protein